MTKLTLLYGNPADMAAFEDYYAKTHLPLAAKMEGIDHIALTKFSLAPDGSGAAYHRMAELFFSTPDQLQKTMGSPEGKAAVEDLSNFATGGVTVLVGEEDKK